MPPREEEFPDQNGHDESDKESDHRIIKYLTCHFDSEFY